MVMNQGLNPDATGYERPTTLKKLMNPMEVSGEGMNTPKQIGESLKSTTTVQDNFYSGFVSANRQYAIKHCFLKEFERKRVLGIELDKKNFGLYANLDTLAAKMALLELQTSNSVEGRYQDNMVTSITGGVKRIWNKFMGKPDNQEGVPQ
jgi:hypothetical protein|tara:strand:- start:120 stop:569 length:450 start_codon:yes stop_codon:yes gene_type:complete